MNRRGEAGGDFGGGALSSNQLEYLGGVVSSPSGVRGGAPAASAFFCISEAHRTLLVQRTVLLQPIFFRSKIHSVDD